MTVSVGRLKYRVPKIAIARSPKGDPCAGWPGLRVRDPLPAAWGAWGARLRWEQVPATGAGSPVRHTDEPAWVFTIPAHRGETEAGSQRIPKGAQWGVRCVQYHAPGQWDPAIPGVSLVYTRRLINDPSNRP